MKQIIICEDEPALGLVLESVFIKAGYAVRCAVDGRWVGDLCKSFLPDLVITDIFMPNRDGFELITELRRGFPNVKILAISGNVAAQSMLAIAEKMGADMTLSKPFPMEEALGAVRALLN